MSYRRSPRYQERIKLRQRAMHEGKARARLEREPVERWEPPYLRMRLTAEQFDSGSPKETVLELFRTTRIDSYDVHVNGVSRGRMGWSKALERLRMAIPRKCSPRRMEE